MISKEARKNACISQAELGRRVSMDQSGISRLQCGERPLKLAMLVDAERAAR
ncbi:MAG: helix-turn-helix transcriptional regulator [Candidatus Thiodiazotropha sp.]